MTRVWGWAWAGVLCVAAALQPGVFGAQFVVDQNAAAASDENPGSAEKPFKSIHKATDVARAGDTVLVKVGLYREWVPLYHSGTAEAPIRLQADPPGSVTVCGSDVIKDWEPLEKTAPVYSTPWKYVFMIGQTPEGKPIEFHPEGADLWGRAEQAFVDGKPLKPCLSLDELKKGWAEHSAAAREKKDAPVLKTPLANLGTPFAGMFFADTRQSKRLYLWLADGSDPRQHQMELSTRDLVIGTNAWAFPEGTQHVIVSGFIFRHAACFPQRGAVWLHGKDNVLENCIVEDMAGSAVGVEGTVRRCVIRRNGHNGGGAIGNGFVNQETLWEGNAWKPIDRGWDSAGHKICQVDGGRVQDCVFRRNGGAGLWFDIHARNIDVENCVFWENEASGLFIEISRNIHVTHCLAVRNAVGVVAGDANWSCAGIQLGESMDCVVSWNTCVGNKDGIAFREQGPRLEKTPDYGDIPYGNRGDVVIGNVCADNAGFAFGYWSDNSFFGWHPAEKDKFKTEDAWGKWIATMPGYNWDPAKMGLTIDRNLYFTSNAAPKLLYGCPWRPKFKDFTALAEFTKASGFDARSAIGDPHFEDAAKNNFHIQREGPAWELQAGWLTAPRDVDAWMNAFLPKFR